MKTSTLIAKIFAATILCCSATIQTVRAGNFSWSAPVPISDADTTLTNLPGTVLAAAVFSGGTAYTVTLGNGSNIAFTANGSVATCTSQGTANNVAGTLAVTTGNANLDAVLQSFAWDSGPHTITLKNLTNGASYSVQLFALDSRSGSTTRTCNFQDPGDATDISQTFTMGANNYLVGYFVATNSTMTIQQNLPTGNSGNMNALVIRGITATLPPSVATQPQSVTAYAGYMVQLSASATGTSPLAYQWQAGATGSGLFTNLLTGGGLTSVTNTTLTFTSLQPANALDYQLIITNAAGSATSSVATVTVLTTAPGVPKYIWSAPVSITSADTTLNVSGVVVGAAVFGPTEKIVTLTNGAVIDFKADGSVASVTGAGSTSAAAAFPGTTGNTNFDGVLQQFSYDGGPKVIYMNNLTPGQQYSVQLFALDDRSGTPSGRSGSYQDPFDAYDYSATFIMGGNVYVIATFTAASSTEIIQENLPNGGGGNMNALVIRAIGVTLPPSFSSQPQPVTAYAGYPAQLSAPATGSAPLQYHWQAGATGSGVFTNLLAGAGFGGVTNATLTFTSLQPANGLDYQMVVANAAGSITSSVATVTVLTSPKYTWSSPVSITSADATLGLDGVVVGAEVFGHTEKVVVLTNGISIDFKIDGSVASVTDGTIPYGGQGQASGGFSGSTGNANFDAVLTQFDYDGGPKTIYLNNLTPGQQYSVQLFALDDRSGSAVRTAYYQDPYDAYDYSASFSMADNVYVVGTFTAASSTELIQENLPNNNGGNMNAVVIRAIGNVLLPPTISQQPSSQSLYAGRTAQFSVGAAGSPAPAYFWQAGSTSSGVFTNLSNAGNISGSSSPILTVAGLTTGNAADYRVIITNSLGSITSSVVNLSIVTTTVNSYESAVLAQNPQAYWRLNETNDVTSGTAIAYDYFGGFNGIYGPTVIDGVPGPLPADGFNQFGTNNTAASFTANDPNSFVSLPPLNFNTNTVTLTAWIKPNGPQSAFTGILFNNNPNGLDDDGIGFGSTLDGTGMAELGYNWNNNDPNTYNFHSGLFPPANQWSFVALVITANDATLYLINSNGTSSATNLYPNVSNSQSSTWNGGTTYIGGNPIVTDGSRNFAGVIDEVGTFKYSMTPLQITGLYQAAVAPAAVIVHIQPIGGGQLQLQWPQGTLLEATNLLGPWTTNNSGSPYTVTPTGAQKFYRVKVQ